MKNTSKDVFIIKSFGSCSIAKYADAETNEKIVEDVAEFEDRKKYKITKMYGIATAEIIDSDNELIKVDGIDYSNLKIINHEHLSSLRFNDPYHIGDIVSVKKGAMQDFMVDYCYDETIKCLAIEFVIKSNSPIGRNISNEVLQKVIKKESIPYCLSIEGKVLERDPKNPNVITKSEMYEVAITTNPANWLSKIYAADVNYEDDGIKKTSNKRFSISEIISRTVTENQYFEELSKSERQNMVEKLMNKAKLSQSDAEKHIQAMDLYGKMKGYLSNK